MNRRADARYPRSTRLLTACVVLYLLGLLAVVLLLHVWADTFWVATVILFAPRWVWALPVPLLVPVALVLRRRLLVPLGAAALLVLGPVMGFELPALAVLDEADGRRDLRVMTYNVGAGHIDPATIAPLLEELQPDVAVFQECTEVIDPRLLKPKGWHVDVVWGSCIASRYPIRKVDSRDPRDMWEMNGSGVMVRYEIEARTHVVHVVNVHLATVREGLTQFMHRGWRAAPALEANIRQRAFESEVARAWTARADGALQGEEPRVSVAPVVVMGDFNMPVESAIYRRFWSSFTNAFSEAGFGFGSTKVTRWHAIRIDHVLLGPGWVCQRAWVGPHVGGDHRPMIADLRWAGGNLTGSVRLLRGPTSRGVLLVRPF